MTIFDSDEQELLERIRLAKAQSIAFLNSDKQPTKRIIGAPVKKKLNSKSGKQCPICKEKMKLSKQRQTPLDNTEATIEHILDLAIGGNNTLENFMIICHRCNEVNNQIMQDYLTISIEDKRLEIGSLDWRKELRTAEKKILRLFKYIEWSFRLGNDSAKGHFPELDALFSEYRYGKIPPILPKTPPSILNKIISYFRRLIRGIGKSGSKNPSNSSGSSVEMEPTEQDYQRKSEEIEFTPEEFSQVLIEQLDGQEELLATAYNGLVNNNPRFKLQKIKAKKYILEKCQDWISIREQPDKSGKSHAWIREKSTEIEMKTELNPDKILEKSKRKAVAKSQKEIRDIRKQIADTNTHAIEEDPNIDSSEPVEFRGMILEIFTEAETTRLSLSALGVRMSRKIKDEGYQNSKEYFQYVHGSSMTLSDALNSYFTNEEIRFTGIPQVVNGMPAMKYTHVELHRRN